MRDKRTTIIALVISLGSILIAQVQGTWEQTATSFKDSEDLMGRGGSWETDWTTDGVGTLDSDHPLAEFVVHTIGDPSKPLIYSFYLIADPHIGDFGAFSGVFDYNKPKWDPPFDQDYGNIGGTSGGQIGRYLDAAVQLINQHYDHGDGGGRFCVVLGDIAASAEIAETEHAKIKLDSLDCPWVPIIGNHDTYPFAHETSFESNDRYFGDILESQFGIKGSEAHRAFPIWTKAVLTKVGPRCHNWSFEWGPNHHVGLDWCKRSLGGGPEPRGTLHNSWGTGTNGENVPRTYPWFQIHLAATAPWHPLGDLILFAHHPLTNGDADFNWSKQFSESERTNILEPIDEYYEYCASGIAHWFAGHYHPGVRSHRWTLGLNDDPTDTVVEHHLLPGIYGWEPGDGEWGQKQRYVGYVEVHGNYKCDFSWEHTATHPLFINVGDTIFFDPDCHSIMGGQYSPESWHWSFGDGVTSTYPRPEKCYWTPAKKYYVRLNATFTSQETYCSKPVLVGYHYPQWTSVSRFRAASSSSLSMPLSFLGAFWYVALNWRSDDYNRWKYLRQRLYRKKFPPGDPEEILADDIRRTEQGVSIYLDGPQPGGCAVRYRVEADWEKVNYDWEDPEEATFPGHDTTIILPVDPGPPPKLKCPEAYVCTRFDSTSQTFEFLPVNTILAHSLTRQVMAKDLLLLDIPPFIYNGLMGLTIWERNTDVSTIDAIKIHVLDHPKEAWIVASADGNVYCCRGFSHPWACYDAFDNDYLCKVLPHTGSDSSLKKVAGDEIQVKFDHPCNSYPPAVVISTGFETEIEYACSLSIAKASSIKLLQKDTTGGWRQLGNAYTRNEPSEWLFVMDTGIHMLPEFKLQFSGDDTACINYIYMTSLVDSGWTDSVISPTIALRWEEAGGPGGEWQSAPVKVELQAIDEVTATLSCEQQIAALFDGIPDPDTTQQRSYVLESYGLYDPESPGGGPMEGESVFAWAFEVKQMQAFSPRATIYYQVPRTERVSIKLYDVSGRQVRSFVDEEVKPGMYSVYWDGKDDLGAKVSSGIYFAKIAADNFNQTQKLVIVK